VAGNWLYFSFQPDPMNTTRKTSTTFAILFLLCTSCMHKRPARLWTEHGTSVQNITWEVPLADSATVLQQRRGNWILPHPPDSVKPKVSVTRHMKPDNNPYPDMLGSVDQEVLHEGGTVTKEFYRFDTSGVSLVGYETSDSASLLTIYEPPLLILPASVERLDTVFFCETTPKVWNALADSFQQEQKTRIRLRQLQEGSVRIDSALTPAVLLQMTLSVDGTVGYGGTDLIVPDAIVMQSNILIIEGLGPLLEWGIRSRKKKDEKAVVHESDSYVENQSRIEEREYYIEVTLHQKINDT
jgi:hypothetical protein